MRPQPLLCVGGDQQLVMIFGCQLDVAGAQAADRCLRRGQGVRTSWLTQLSFWPFSSGISFFFELWSRSLRATSS